MGLSLSRSVVNVLNNERQCGKEGDEGVIVTLCGLYFQLLRDGGEFQLIFPQTVCFINYFPSILRIRRTVGHRSLANQKEFLVDNLFVSSEMLCWESTQSIIC